MLRDVSLVLCILCMFSINYVYAELDCDDSSDSRPSCTSLSDDCTDDSDSEEEEDNGIEELLSGTGGDNESGRENEGNAQVHVHHFHHHFYWMMEAAQQRREVNPYSFSIYSAFVTGRDVLVNAIPRVFMGDNEYYRNHPHLMAAYQNGQKDVLFYIVCCYVLMGFFQVLGSALF